jgi:hypothetical protein
VKLRAVNNFITIVGDLPMDGITREHARELYNWWAGRLIPQGNKKALTTNSANRDPGNIRKLYRQYWEFEGDQMRENPFRNLSFRRMIVSSNQRLQCVKRRLSVYRWRL